MLKVSDLEHVLIANGSSLHELDKYAEDLVVFGSRVRGVSEKASDWDLLLVGELPPQFERIDADVPVSRARSGALDLVAVDPEHVFTVAWLQSELANHVAAFGLCLWGDAHWADDACITDRTIDAKVLKIQNSYHTLVRLRGRVGPSVIRRRRSKLRRDLQRLDLLIAGSPCYATAELDEEWHHSDTRDRIEIVEAAEVATGISADSFRRALRDELHY